MPTFQDDLTGLINRYSKENGSDTPDFILAQYLEGCLSVFDKAVKHRTEWSSHTVRDVNVPFGHSPDDANRNDIIEVENLYATLDEDHFTGSLINMLSSYLADGADEIYLDVTAPDSSPERTAVESVMHCLRTPLGQYHLAVTMERLAATEILLHRGDQVTHTTVRLSDKYENAVEIELYQSDEYEELLFDLISSIIAFGGIPERIVLKGQPAIRVRHQPDIAYIPILGESGLTGYRPHSAATGLPIADVRLPLEIVIEKAQVGLLASSVVDLSNPEGQLAMELCSGLA